MRGAGARIAWLLLLSAGTALPASAQSWCRQGGVDLLVGGARPACTAPPAAAARRAAPADDATRVSVPLQARRDLDRRAILEQELQALLVREQALRRAAGDGGDDDRLAALRRTLDDLRAVRAELARLPTT